MDIDAVIRAERVAEIAIRDVLLDIQKKTGRRVDWVKVDVRNGMLVTVNTVSK